MDYDKKLKQLIKKHGFLIKDVAAHLGMSYSNFNNKLTRGNLKYEDLEKALRFIGYSIEWKRDK